MMYVCRSIFKLLLALLVLDAATFSLNQNAFATSNESPQSFNYQGRFMNGAVPLSGTWDLKFEIYAPGGTCLMYQEIDPGINLTISNGNVAINVGSLPGAGVRGPLDPNLAMSVIFQNLYAGVPPEVPNTVNCSGGWTPTGSQEVRLLRVYYGTSGAYTQLTPDQPMYSVPTALVAQSLQGLGPANFVQVTNTNWGTLTAGATSDASSLHNHDTHNDGRYAQLGGTSTQNFAAQNITATDETLTGWLAVGSGGAANASIDVEKATPAAIIIGSTGTSGNTMSLNFDSNTAGTTNASITATDNSNTLKIQTGGSTAVTVNPNQSVSFANSIGLGGGLGLWSTNAAGDASYVATLGAGQEGTLWENNTTKNVRYWNGTTAINLAQQNAVVNSIGAGTGTTVTGTTTVPVVNVTYGTAANTAIQGNQAFTGDVTGTVGATVVSKLQTYTLDLSTPPGNNQVLTYSTGTNKWTAQAAASGVPTLTLGSVIFSGGGTTLSQDNTKFFWDDTNVRLGVNAGATPGNELSINAPAHADALAQSMITTSAVTNKALVLQEGAAQTANMMEVQNSAGTVLYSVESTGTPTANSDLINKSYYNTTSANWGSNYVKKDGTVALTATWDVGNETIKNLAAMAIGTATSNNPLNVNVAAHADALAQGLIGTSVATNKGLVVQGVASQSANLIETQNSGGTVLTEIDAAGKLGLVNLAADPGGLTAADKGKVWFNSTANQIKYYDGSAIQTLGTAGSGLTSLNGLTASTQTFTNDTNVTITSSLATHTLGWTGTLAFGRGGTGAVLAPAGAGELVYSSSTTALASLAAGTAKRVLASSGAGAPVWSTDLTVDNTNHLVTFDAGGTPAADGIIVSAIPFASATTSLVRLGTSDIAAGNASGTFLGVNQAAATADFINYEVAGASKFLVDKSGNVSATSFSGSGAGLTGITPTFAGLTAGGVAYGTSATALTTTGAGTAGVPLLSGAAAAPTWSTINMASGNIVMPAAGSISNASGAMTVSATTNLTLQSGATTNFVLLQPTGGNVGIGTSTPGAQLEVDSKADTTIGQIVKANSATTSADLWEIQNQAGVKQVYVDSSYILHGNGSGLTGIASAFSGLNPGGVGYATSATTMGSSAAGSVNQVLVSGAAASPTWTADLLADGTNHVVTVDSGGAPVGDGLIVIQNPTASTTKSLVRLGSADIGGGNASGTFLGVNQAAATADFLNYEVSGASKFLVDKNGLVILGGDPTANLGAATKQYVNSAISSANGNYLPLIGGTMTGPLINNSNAATTALAVTQSGTGYAATFTGGLVGIGTTNPTDNLMIASTGGGLTFTNTNGGSDSQITFINDVSNEAGQFWVNGSTNAGFGGPNSVNLFGGANGPMNFWTNTNQRMTITATGRVGIGTTAPLSLLNVSGAVSGTPTNAHGSYLTVNLQAFTDNATAASGTAGTAIFNYLGAPSIAASNTGVTTSNAVNFYLNGPPAAGTNETITNTYGIFEASTAVNTVGTVSNAYGAYINAPTGATNNVAAAFVGGNVGIGSVLPGAQLQVTSRADTLIGQIIRPNSATASADLFDAQTFAGSNLVRIDASGNLGLVSVTADPSGLAAGDAGKMWYRSDLNQIKYWNGTIAVVMATGGGTTPGGANTQIQFNNSSAFAGSSDFVWNNASHSLILNTTNAPTGDSLVIAQSPTASATNSLFKLGATDIASGNASGTFLGVNQAAATADFINYEVAGASKFLVDKSGNVSATSFSGSGAGLTGITPTFSGLNPGGVGFASSATAFSSSAAGVANQVLVSGGAATPTWTSDLTVDSTNHLVTLDASGTPNSDGLVVNSGPSASATNSLVRLGTTDIVGGNASGTFLGINQATSASHFLNFQVAGSSKFAVDGTGTITARNIIINRGANDGYTGSSVTSAAPSGTNPQIGNGFFTDGNEAFQVFRAGNSASVNQYGYMGAVSVTGAGNYTPALVFGQATGAAAYNERMRLDTTGYLGVNTLSPGAQVEVDSSANGTIGQIIKAAPAPTADLWEIQNNAGVKQVYVDSAFKLHGDGSLLTGISGSSTAPGNNGNIPFNNGSNTFVADTTNLFWDATNHRLGIGTTSPVASLNLNSGGTANNDTLLVGNNTTKGLQLRDTGTAVDIQSVGVGLYINSVGTLATYIGGSGGLVGIGTSSNSTAALKVYSNSDSIAGIQIQPHSATSTADVLDIYDYNGTRQAYFDPSEMLYLKADPTSNLMAATKAYVDAVSTNLGTNYIKKDGTVAMSAAWNVGAQPFDNISTLSIGTATVPTGGVATFNGNVGIGTTTPGMALDVHAATYGGIKLTNANQYGGYVLSNGTNTVVELEGFSATNDNGVLNLYSGGTKTIAIQASGNSSMGSLGLNVGGASVQSRLDVGGNVSVGSYAGVNAAPTNGLIVSGLVGVGTISPVANLDVAGQIHAQVYGNGSATAINWNNGNVQTTSAACNGSGTQFSFTNMLEGGSYTLIVTGTATGSCNFSNAGSTSVSPSGVTGWAFVPTNATAPAGTTVYTMLRAGNVVYVSWISSFPTPN